MSGWMRRNGSSALRASTVRILFALARRLMNAAVLGLSPSVPVIGVRQRS